MDLTFYFTVEEQCILAAYRADTVAETIKNIRWHIPLFEEEEMKELARKTIKSLERVSDEDFAKVEFYPPDEVDPNEYDPFERA